MERDVCNRRILGFNPVQVKPNLKTLGQAHALKRLKKEKSFLCPQVSASDNWLWIIPYQIAHFFIRFDQKCKVL